MDASIKENVNEFLERTVWNWKFDISMFLMLFTIVILLMFGYIAAGNQINDYPVLMYFAENLPNICLIMSMILIFSVFAALLEDRK